MNATEKLIAELREANKKRTQGEMISDGPIVFTKNRGYVVAAAESTPSLDGRSLWARKRDQAAFIALAANSMEKLLSIIEVQREAMSELSNKRAMMVFAEEPEHVAHFMQPVDAAFEECDRIAEGKE